ncbi:MAG: isochorismatase family protein [Dehalococcoidia bacterium]
MHPLRIDENVLQRVKERRGRVHLYDRLVPARTALVVIDMQNAFCKPGAPVEVPISREVVPNINRLAEVVRQRGGDVVWIVTEIREQRGRTDWDNFVLHIVAEQVRKRTVAYMAPGAEGTLLWQEIKTEPADLFMVKNRYSCLAPGASPLERTLRSRGVDTLLITGTKTNVCCEATARAAWDMDFNVVMVADGCAALSDREHAATLETIIQQFGDVMSTDEVIERLHN